MEGRGFNLYGRLQLIGLTEGRGLQPKWEVATLIGLMEGRGFNLYGKLQLIGLTEGRGFNLYAGK
jgi:hypothetical protein